MKNALAHPEILFNILFSRADSPCCRDEEIAAVFGGKRDHAVIARIHAVAEGRRDGVCGFTGGALRPPINGRTMVCIQIGSV